MPNVVTPHSSLPCPKTIPQKSRVKHLLTSRVATVMENMELLKKNYGISGKIMESWLKLRLVLENVMEMSWILTNQSHMSLQIGTAAQCLKNVCKDLGHGIMQFHHGKVLEFWLMKFRGNPDFALPFHLLDI